MTVAKGVCRFWQSRPCSVNAHIIPASFFRARALSGNNNLLFSHKSDFAKKSHTGVYDELLVCAECETKFGPYDDYGFEFFKLKGAAPLVSPDNLERLVWQSPVDYTKLKLFVLSILWRASASDRPECASAKLGRFEETIREMIESGNAGPADRFPVLLQRYDQGQDSTPVSLPHRARIEVEGVNFYKTELAGCAIWVVIDERKLISTLKEASLAPGKPALVMVMDYFATQEWRRMRQMLVRIRNNTGRWPGQ